MLSVITQNCHLMRIGCSSKNITLGKSTPQNNTILCYYTYNKKRITLENELEGGKEWESLKDFQLISKNTQYKWTTSMRHTDTAIQKSMITQEKQNDAWIFLAIKRLNVLFLLVERKSRHSVPQNYRSTGCALMLTQATLIAPYQI